MALDNYSTQQMHACIRAEMHTRMHAHLFVCVCVYGEPRWAVDRKVGAEIPSTAS